MTAALATLTMTIISIPIVLASCDEKRPNVSLRVTRVLAWMAGVVMIIVGSGMFVAGLQ